MATPKKPAPKVIEPGRPPGTVTVPPGFKPKMPLPYGEVPPGSAAPPSLKAPAKPGYASSGPTPNPNAVKRANPNARFKSGPRKKRPVIKEPDRLWHHW